MKLEELIHTLRISKTFSAIYFCWRVAPFCCTLSGWMHNVAFLYCFLTAAPVIKSVKDTACHPDSGQSICSEKRFQLVNEIFLCNLQSSNYFVRSIEPNELSLWGIHYLFFSNNNCEVNVRFTGLESTEQLDPHQRLLINEINNSPIEKV